MGWKILLAGSTLGALAALPNANAASISFDDIATQGGTLSYAVNDVLKGTNIKFDTVVGIGTPSNAGVTTCTNCSFSFNTGTLISALTTGNTTNYLFNGGGFATLTGEVIAAATGPNATLATGSFSGPVSATLVDYGSVFRLALQVGSGYDQKNDALEAYFGLPTNQAWIFAQTTIAAQGVIFDSVGKSFSGSVADADFGNTAVPVPAAIWLFGSALAGFGVVGRRRPAAA